MMDAGFITGLGSVGTGDEARMLILLDIDRLMSGEDIALVETVAAWAAVACSSAPHNHAGTDDVEPDLHL